MGQIQERRREAQPGEEPRFVIACNYNEATQAVQYGCLAFLAVHGEDWYEKGGHDRLRLRARSRSGRPIIRWEPIGRLKRFRLYKLFPDDRAYTDDRIFSQDEETVRRLAGAIEGLRLAREEAASAGAENAVP